MPDIPYNTNLGVSVTETSTDFKVWAPEAQMCELLVYDNQHSLTPKSVIAMSRTDDGIWQYTHNKSLAGTYYNYRFTYNGKQDESVDIYAKACGCNGERGYIADFSKLSPKGWESDTYVTLNSYADAVIYETHIRDFSSSDSSGVTLENRGKFTAFTETDTHTQSGSKTCLDYITDLGITHIHLLPAFDYEGVNEANPQEYNWGYNPKNFNVPEGSYSTDPFDPECRIIQFKKMVQSLHSKGIGVVMDVVYNHTYYGDDSWFEITYPGYYHRFYDGRYSNGSGCGNEFASEREMCRKYIVDSVLWWAKEYHIDGFRFDLMALLDVDTLNEVYAKLKEINPNVIIYGEGWTGGISTLSGELSASEANAFKTPNIAYFNDGFRDSIKGNTFVGESKGYVAGNIHCRAGIINGLLGNIWWAGSPLQTVNYCEAHDNYTMWDKLCISSPASHTEDHKKMQRLSLALVFLSQGIPFIQAGQEFARTKIDSNGNYVDNSYNSPDSVNAINWDRLGAFGCESEYAKGLISFRKENPLLRLRSKEQVDSSYEVLPCGDGMISLKWFNEDEEILILVNPIPRAKMFVLPDGEWQVYVTDIKAGVTPLATYCEGVFVPPISAMVLKKKNIH